MSFFLEPHSDTIVLFSSHTDNEAYKRLLSNMGGTFCRELETKKGNKYPAWIFESSKKEDVEAFVLENEDRESVVSLPDIESNLDEIYRRLETLEKALENIYEVLDELTRARKHRHN